MRYSKVGGAMAAILAASLAQGIQAQETICPLDSWGGFREGSWVRQSMTVQKGEKKTSEREITMTLESLEENEAKVRYDFGERQTMTFPLRRDGAGCIAPRVEASSLRNVKQEALGQEEVRIAGKSLSCKVWSVTFQKVHRVPPNGGPGQHVEDFTIKFWESGEIPGKIARIKGKAGDKQFSGEVKALGEEIAIGSKKLTCALLEVNLKPGRADANWNLSESLWLTNTIPGGVARRQIVQDGNACVWTFAVQDFEAKK